MWGPFVQRRGSGASVALIVLALFQQLQLAAQQQHLLLLRGQRLIELTHGVLLVGQLGLHSNQLPFHLVDFPQAWLSPFCLWTVSLVSVAVCFRCLLSINSFAVCVGQAG
jgi:hypothetical protein